MQPERQRSAQRPERKNLHSGAARLRQLPDAGAAQGAEGDAAQLRPRAHRKRVELRPAGERQHPAEHADHL